MAVKNKAFGISSLCIIAVIAIISAFVLDDNKKANMEHEETVEFRDSQSSSKLVTDDEMTNANKVVDNIESELDEDDDFAEEVDIITYEGPEENEYGIVPIPGEEVPGIDYTSYIDYSKYSNVAIVGVKQYVNIRKEAGEKHEVVGKLQPNGGCTYIETVVDSKNIRWAKIQSGDVSGYVKEEFLITGKEALAMVSSVGRLVIRAKCDELNVRESASLDAKILYRINAGEELDILSVQNDWLEVKVDFGDESAYISRDYVNIAFDLYKAYSVKKVVYEDESESKEASSQRESIVGYAEKFLGCPYVYGGTSFKTGIDCSAYVQQIFAHYGYKLPRNSAAQSNAGKSISASQLRPGDLVFYKRGGKIGHVAIYIGNNRIIHASNKRDGVKYSNMYYTTPAKYVRVVK